PPPATLARSFSTSRLRFSIVRPWASIVFSSARASFFRSPCVTQPTPAIASASAAPATAGACVTAPFFRISSQRERLRAGIFSGAGEIRPPRRHVNRRLHRVARAASLPHARERNLVCLRSGRVEATRADPDPGDHPTMSDPYFQTLFADRIGGARY